MEAVAEIDKLKKEITRINLTAAHSILNRWLKKARTAYPNLLWEDGSQSMQFPNVGFPVARPDYPRAFKVFLQIDTWHNSVYYGIYLADSRNMPFAEARNLLKPTLETLDKFNYSPSAKMFFAYLNIADGYDKFDNLTRTILKHFS